METCQRVQKLSLQLAEWHEVWLRAFFLYRTSYRCYIILARNVPSVFSNLSPCLLKCRKVLGGAFFFWGTWVRNLMVKTVVGEIKISQSHQQRPQIIRKQQPRAFLGQISYMPDPVLATSSQCLLIGISVPQFFYRVGVFAIVGWDPNKSHVNTRLQWILDCSTDLVLQKSDALLEKR